MQIEVKIPDLAATESEITVIKWLVPIGQAVHRGQALLEVETDKATMEVESFASGVLKRTLAQPGDKVSVGQVIALIEGEPEAASASPGGMFARNRQAAQSAPPAGPPSAIGDLTPAQRTVARRLQQSKQTVPHFYLQTSANARSIVARRQAAGKKLIWDAFLVHAAAQAMRRFPRMMCRFQDDQLAAQPDAIGVAADVDGDLYLIPIASPADKTVEQISEEIAAGSARLHERDPRARMLQPCCMTISNLGAAGVESFLAIINPPESCTLAAGKATPTVVASDSGIEVQDRMRLTLSVDHRVASGKYAAEFLDAIVKALELM